MGRQTKIKPHLSTKKLERCYRSTTDTVLRTHFHHLWLLAQGYSVKEVGAVTGYGLPWIREIARRYNRKGPQGLGDRRKNNRCHQPLLTEEELQELADAMQSPPPDGGMWNGPKTALWIANKTGKKVHPQRGWDYLVKLGYSLRRPRPCHVKADPAAQSEFKKNFHKQWQKSKRAIHTPKL